jgi:hypothetical protein
MFLQAWKDVFRINELIKKQKLQEKMDNTPEIIIKNGIVVHKYKRLDCILEEDRTSVVFYYIMDQERVYVYEKALNQFSSICNNIDRDYLFKDMNLK